MKLPHNERILHTAENETPHNEHGTPPPLKMKLLTTSKMKLLTTSPLLHTAENETPSTRLAENETPPACLK